MPACPSIPEQNAPKQRPDEAAQGSAPLPFWIRSRREISAGVGAAPRHFEGGSTRSIADRLAMVVGNRFTLTRSFRLLEGILIVVPVAACGSLAPFGRMRHSYLRRTVARVAAEFLEILG